jgi:hypothetical protein
MRINKGGGWDRSSALEFLMEHELNYIVGSDNEQRFKFRQRILTEVPGELEILDENMPRGVDLVLEIRK